MMTSQGFIFAFLLSLFISCGLPEKCADNEGAAKYSQDKNRKEHYNVVLMGATGSLARKYLWHALFTVFRQRYVKDVVQFRIYASARLDADEGRRKLSRLLLALVNCETDTVIGPDCHEMKRKFVESVQYHRLKTERDFMELSDLLYENTQSIYAIEPGSPVTYEQGRLVYMAIPPSAYAVTARYVHTYLRPKIGRPWMRIVIEKPFGQDLSSAQVLARDLSKYFDDTEVYRVDHYLGKPTVKQILPFRYINRKVLEPIWNRDYIEQVDIVMKEREDVAGRTKFYDDIGVIRDVMQNHLTEMFSLVAMDLPADSGNITALFHSKLHLLRDVRHPSANSLVTGQYATYNSERFKDRENKSETFKMSTTPTFAAVLLHVDNWRWRDVPFVLVSGRKLDEKASYIRIRFRDSQFCLSTAVVLQDHLSCFQNNQIVFHVGDVSSRSTIAVSNGLPKPEAPRFGWSRISGEDEKTWFGQHAGNMMQFVVDEETLPYVELLEAAFDGARHLFVPTDILLASWNIWTTVSEHAESVAPRQYMGRGKDSSRLDFLIAQDGSLRYWVDERNVPHYSLSQTDSTSIPDDVQIPALYRNSTLVSGTRDKVSAALAEFIVERAHKKVASGADFHLVLSGGQTPEKLLQRLAQSSLPWPQTHVWMVDEHCDGSNFETIERLLLRPVSTLRLLQVHPMLPDLDDSPCSTESQYRRDRLYEHAIRRLVVNSSFDVVVLGVGTDGHTASLFPGDLAAAQRDDSLVTFSQSPPIIADSQHLQPLRITLTLSAINAAHNVAVLVTGSHKHSIVKAIENVADAVTAGSPYPILSVKPTSGTLTWFIDYSALFGSSD